MSDHPAVKIASMEPLDIVEDRVFRTKVEVTLYSRGPLDQDIGEVEMWTQLSGWIDDANDGDMIGDWRVTDSQPVEGDQLRLELVEIGNDGAFFDELD